MAAASSLLQEIILTGLEGLDPQARVSPDPTSPGSRLSSPAAPPQTPCPTLACSICPGPSGCSCELPGLQNPFTDHSAHCDVAGFSFVSTVRASELALSGPRLGAGLTPRWWQAGHLWRACLGSRNPSLSSLPRVRVLQAAGAPSFHPAKTSGASGAPGSRVWPQGCLLGFRPCPPPFTCCPLASGHSAVPRGHGMAPAHGDKL